MGRILVVDNQEIIEKIKNTMHEDVEDVVVFVSQIQQQVSKEEFEVEEYIRESLKNLHIYPNIKGYHYILRAVLLVCRDKKEIMPITAILYPKIAELYNTTPSRVERSIRHAIEKAYMEHMFDELGKKPTNSEFITMLCEKIYMFSERQYINQ